MTLIILHPQSGIFYIDQILDGLGDFLQNLLKREFRKNSLGNFMQRAQFRNALLAFMFSPVFDGENAFTASDKLFNSIAKGSTNYFPKLKNEAKPFAKTAFKGTLKLEDEATARAAADLLGQAGAQVEASGAELSVQIELGRLIGAVLRDAEAMFHNDGQQLKSRYNIEERLSGR